MQQEIILLLLPVSLAIGTNWRLLLYFILNFLSAQARTDNDSVKTFMCRLYLDIGLVDRPRLHILASEYCIAYPRPRTVTKSQVARARPTH
jgi:hypothetical protein